MAQLIEIIRLAVEEQHFILEGVTSDMNGFVSGIDITDRLTGAKVASITEWNNKTVSFTKGFGIQSGILGTYEAERYLPMINGINKVLNDFGYKMFE